MLRKKWFALTIPTKNVAATQKKSVKKHTTQVEERTRALLENFVYLDDTVKDFEAT